MIFNGHVEAINYSFNTNNNFQPFHDYIYRYYLHNENRDASNEGVFKALRKFPILLSSYKLEDVYNLDEIGLYFYAQPKMGF